MCELDKKSLRKEIIELRDALLKSEREEKSVQIADKVINFKEFHNSNKVLLYDSIRSEVETLAIYQAARRLGKMVYYPRVIGDEMRFYRIDETTEFETSEFGIREPKEDASKQFFPKKEDMLFVLMPGIAFDEAGNRIGYGGGYYDRYLEWLEKTVPHENICKVAVAYECQMVVKGRIKKEEHDVYPNYIVTECEEYVV